MLGLAAVAVTALLVVAGTATGTYLTSPSGTTYTGAVTASSAGRIEKHAGSGTSFLTVSCNKANFEWNVEAHGAGVTARGKVTKLNFLECTDVVTVLAAGEMELHASNTTGNGTLTSNFAEVRIHTSEGPVCTEKTSGTDIGTFTGTHQTGGSAKLDVGSAAVPVSGFLCPSTTIWTGSFTYTSPGTLNVH
jgi:hypothetical protein